MSLKFGLWALSLCSTVLVGCQHVSASGTVTEQPKQYIVVLDASSSRTPDTLMQDEDFAKQVAKRLSFGDRITFIQMQQVGLTDHSQPWSAIMPHRQDTTFDSRRDHELLATKQNGVALVVPGFFKKATATKVLHTDIFATLHVVGEVQQAAAGRQSRLLLLSDMLQSAKGVEMDHALAMPPRDWINQQKRLGALPKLDGICVIVVGADASDGAGVKVRNFWEEYFRAAGATFKTANYLFMPPPEDRPLCD